MHQLAAFYFNTMNLELNKVFHMDNLEGMALLPEKCANLIIADPPYFEVKGDFDFVFKDFAEYLEFMEQQAKAYKRILADNGTLFVYGHAKRIAYVQVIFDKYFNLENNAVWENTNPHKQQIRFSDGLRCFAPITERLLMYSNEIEMTGLEMIKLDVQNFKPLRAYFEYLQKTLNVPKKVFLDSIGQTSDHCFRWGSTQWDLPTPETYAKLIEVFKIDRLEGFKEYEALRREYEALRRPFNNFRNFGDVIKVPNYETGDYDHDTVKPEELTRTLILTCSRPNDLVVVPFSGSGTEHAMAIREGRRSIGFDIEKKYVDMSNKRAAVHLSAPPLFNCG